MLTDRPASPTEGNRPPRPPRDERQAGVAPVSCSSCAATVLVAKFSPQHTSVQWSLEAMETCSEFGALTAAGADRALISGCASLRESIDAAVASGQLAIEPP